MLFNSYELMLVFLPITLIGFFLIGTAGYQRIAILWLVVASLVYYGWWNPAYLLLILGSILINYGLGTVLGKEKGGGKKGLLSVGVILNLALLGYYKYANFFVDSVNALASTNYHLEKILLPLAISFFTFQQVAYLIDAYRGETSKYSFLHYCLFVCFFPQLIAGPIVHHKDILPQFEKKTTYQLNAENIAIGLTVFFIGLFKKVVLADTLALYVDSAFSSSGELGLIASWTGALAYTFQLYFDFSGYSDMAIGISRMFGIRLPINFNSPYKSHSIIEFWRRWHMTLSVFLRDYLYFSLGGSRKGKIRTQVNLMLTMLLGGLWHGAGWTFVVWGGLHGFYLMVNHSFRAILKHLGVFINDSNQFIIIVSRLLTFLAVVVGWVFFRAIDFTQASHLLLSMVGINGVGIFDLRQEGPAFLLLGVSFFIVWCLPNAQEYLSQYQVSSGEVTIKERRGWIKHLLVFQFNKTSIIIMTFLMLITGLMLQSVLKSEFLYYDF